AAAPKGNREKRKAWTSFRRIPSSAARAGIYHELCDRVRCEEPLIDVCLWERVLRPRFHKAPCKDARWQRASSSRTGLAVQFTDACADTRSPHASPALHALLSLRITQLSKKTAISIKSPRSLIAICDASTQWR